MKVGGQGSYTLPRVGPDGLHTRECECVGCSIGHGPTERQRTAVAHARRKLALRKAAEAAALLGMGRKEIARQEAAERARQDRCRTLGYVSGIEKAAEAPGMTDEERAEVRKQIEEFKAKGKKR